MDPLLRAATMAVITAVALGGAGGLLALRAWLQLAAGLAIWGAFGGVLIGFLAAASWRLRHEEPAPEEANTPAAGRLPDPLVTRHAA